VEDITFYVLPTFFSSFVIFGKVSKISAVFRVSYEEFFTFDFIASRFDVETEFDGAFLILILF